jgi:NAD(P)-dependent dehydrogenase (short-subunit alcohol dehydrogenase family)
MDLKNKTVLITGGVVRVGRAITLELLAAGANVFCHYNSSHQEATSLAEMAEGHDGNLHLIQGDLGSLSFAHKMVDQVIHEAGRLDALINNAAIFFKTPVGEVTEDDWERLFHLNLKVPFFCAQKAGVHMKKQGIGKIINIGDPSGLSPWPSYIPYGLTKSGIISMTKGLAKALAPDVMVNCVNPGPVMFPASYTDEDRERALKNTLLKKEGSAKDIANMVRFILEGSDYITGAIFNVDGGRSIA